MRVLPDNTWMCCRQIVDLVNQNDYMEKEY